MRSFIIGCLIVAVALGILAYVAIYPYMGRVRLPALPVATVADRSLPPVTIDSDREKTAQSLRLVATDSQTEKVTTSPPAVADPHKEKVTRSKPAVASTANRPSPSQCGPGLAAQDLAGECRAKPCPTMGALETPGASAAPKAKPICSVPISKSKTSSSSKQSKEKKKKNKRKTKSKKKKIEE